MKLPPFLIKQMILFFMLSTLIAVAVSLIGSAFDRGAQFGYDVLLTPVKYAALCMLPTLVTYSRRELSMKALLLRKSLMLVLLEAGMLLVLHTSAPFDAGRMDVVLVIAGSVLVIFLLAQLFLWLKESAEAKRLTQDLERFQKRYG